MYYITVSSFLQMVDEIFCKIISVYDIEKIGCPENSGQPWDSIGRNQIILPDDAGWLLQSDDCQWDSGEHHRKHKDLSGPELCA